MKILKLIVGSLLLLVGFLLLISEELPGEELNLTNIIFMKILSITVMIIGYKLIKSLGILDEYTS